MTNPERMAKFSFNSTLVRLRLRKREASSAALLSFNSTLVRLRLLKLISRLSLSALFQFHSGSIKTSLSLQSGN